jgi:hypothetical protein
VKTQFVTAPDGRKVAVPAGMSLTTAIAITAKVTKNRKARQDVKKITLHQPPQELVEAAAMDARKRRKAINQHFTGGSQWRYFDKPKPRRPYECRFDDSRWLPTSSENRPVGNA